MSTSQTIPPGMNEQMLGQMMKMRAVHEHGHLTASVYDLFINGHISRQEAAALAEGPTEAREVPPAVKQATQTWVRTTDPAILHMVATVDIGGEVDALYKDLFHCFMLLQSIEVGTPGEWQFTEEEAFSKLQLLQWHSTMEILRRMGLIEIPEQDEDFWSMKNFTIKKAAAFPEDWEEADRLLRAWVPENSPMLQRARKFDDELQGEEGEE